MYFDYIISFEIIKNIWRIVMKKIIKKLTSIW